MLIALEALDILGMMLFLFKVLLAMGVIYILEK